MQMNNGTLPSMFTTSWFTACNCCDLIDLNESYQAIGSKSWLNILGQAPVSSNLTSVIKAFEVTAIEIWRRQVALQKKDVTSCGSSINYTLNTYCAVGSGCRIFVFALASDLLFLLISVAMNVTLHFCILGVLDEWLSLMS